MEKKSVRIAHIIGRMCAGGVESVVFNYYRQINKDVIQFDFYYDSDSTIEPPEELVSLGARFFKVPAYKNLNKYINTLYNHFKINNYDIVHSHLNTLSIFPLFAAKMAGIPIRIAHNHSVPGGNEWRRNALKYFLKNFSKTYATDYFACSEKAGRWLFGNRIYEDGKVFILRNAVDFEKYLKEYPESTEMIQKLNIKDKFIVGNVGRFTFAKNHSFLLEVFKLVKKERNDAILLLVGDGELREEIIEKINTLGISDSVIMAGKVSNPEIYYKLMNVLLIPSIFEGLSLTAIEGQISGIPVLASEAVPIEAKISSAFKYLSLSESALCWAEEVIKISQKKSYLTEEHENYDIKRKVSVLENWYLNRIEKLN